MYLGQPFEIYMYLTFCQNPLAKVVIFLDCLLMAVSAMFYVKDYMSKVLGLSL